MKKVEHKKNRLVRMIMIIGLSTTTLFGNIAFATTLELQGPEQVQSELTQLQTQQDDLKKELNKNKADLRVPGILEGRAQLRARNKSIKRSLRDLKARLKKLAFCLKALKYVNNRKLPYPQNGPGKTKEGLDEEFRQFIVSINFRLGNINRTIRAARAVAPQANDILRKNLRMRKLYREVLRKARADRARIQDGSIVVPPPVIDNGNKDEQGNEKEEDKEPNNDDEQNAQIVPGVFNPQDPFVVTLESGSYEMQISSIEEVAWTALVQIVDEIEGELASEEVLIESGSTVTFPLEVPEGSSYRFYVEGLNPLN